MTSPAPSALPDEGDLVAGKYRVERVLGKGAMGVVVAAVHEQLGMAVALKFLRPDIIDDPNAVERFMREGRAAANLRSEHVVRVLDVGISDGGAPFLAMEYLQGEDLASVVRRRGPLPIEEVVDYVLQATEALAEVHAAGIVHRDLKPANLFLTRRGDGSSLVKVCDFGISKAGSRLDESLTSTAQFVGTPLYASPEQLTSARDVDARTDIWALGATMFELLTGGPPFKAATLVELLARVVGGRAPELAPLRPDAPPELASAVARCLEPSLERRFSNVAELAVAIADFGPMSSRVSVDRVVRLVGGTTAPMTETLSSVPAPSMSGTVDAWATRSHGRGTALAPPRRARGLLPVLLAIACLALGALAVVASTVHRTSSAASSVASSASRAPGSVVPATPGPLAPAAAGAAAPVAAPLPPVAPAWTAEPGAQSPPEVTHPEVISVRPQTKPGGPSPAGVAPRAAPSPRRVQPGAPPGATPPPQPVPHENDEPNPLVNMNIK